MDNINKEKIIDMVFEKMRLQQMFTAFDITAQARQQIDNERISHSEVKQIVHGLFEDNEMDSFDYKRSLGNLQNVNPQPWIYHHFEDSEVDYPGNRLATANATTQPAMPTVLLAKDDKDDTSSANNPDGVYKVDGRGTICVPASLVKSLGAKHHDRLYVHANYVDNQLEINEEEDGAISSYTVDHGCNIRITQSLLRNAGLGGSLYEISGDDEEIILKKYNPTVVIATS